MDKTLEKKVKNLPQVPGIYKYFNSRNEIIYIGKAINLRARVGSYFNVKLDPRSKTQALVSEIADLEYIETQSEIEALVLEAELIKKHQPFYNINLKDSKSFLYIVIRPDRVRTDKGLRSLPKILVARKSDLQDADEYYGPFPNSTITRSVVRTIRKIFKYRDCSKSKFSRYEKRKTPCLYGQINLCSAPCVNQNESDFKEYRNSIRKIRDFLQGKTNKIVKSLEKGMFTASKSQNYEKAAYYRDLLNKFKYVQQSFRTPKEYIDNPYLVYDLAENAMKDIQDFVPSLTKLPEKIECYDISTVSGTDSVGSMVVAINGRIDKSEYKRFRIKTKNTPDDFGMMAEVLRRRLKREVSEAKNIKKWGLPDLIVLDGGKGQVSAIQDVLLELDINVPLVGLAKKEETVVIPTEKGFGELKLSQDNSGLKLLIKLRDESHRFAQKYHHYLRKKRISE